MLSTAIGIVAGSGPEAGIDLWTKVLASARRQLGPDFRGDTDAPPVVVVSDPRLGASLHLGRDPAAGPSIRDTLVETVRRVAAHAPVLAIACNTLHVFLDDAIAAAAPSEIVSYPGAALAHVRSRAIRRVGLLAADAVGAPGARSPYTGLAAEVEVVTPARPEPLDALIADVKRHGPGGPGLRERLDRIVDELDCQHVLLACTELPLIGAPGGDAELIDVTALVADALVASSWARCQRPRDERRHLEGGGGEPVRRTPQ